MKNRIPKMVMNMALSCILLTSSASQADAQCPMCKLSAESNLKSGGQAGRGLNTGIFYLLAMPYLAVGTVGYLWWRNKKRAEQEVA